jgi:hypothetical protein
MSNRWFSWGSLLFASLIPLGLLMSIRFTLLSSGDLYVSDPPYDLSFTFCGLPHASFGVPPWVVPGGHRQLTVASQWTYKCH